MFKFLKKKDPIDDFWSWFEKNRTFYEDLDDSQLGENLGPIYEQVCSIAEGLAVEISRSVDGVRELVISANGDRSHFPTVSAIVAAAPRFDRWTVTAFRPRIPEASVLKADDLEFDISQMFFTPVEEDGELIVFVFAENIKNKDERKVFGLGMIIIDNLLGEYDSVMKVQAFGFRDIEEAPEDWPLRPLIELPGFVDEIHQKKNN